MRQGGTTTLGGGGGGGAKPPRCGGGVGGTGPRPFPPARRRPLSGTGPRSPPGTPGGVGGRARPRAGHPEEGDTAGVATKGDEGALVPVSLGVGRARGLLKHQLLNKRLLTASQLRVRVWRCTGNKDLRPERGLHVVPVEERIEGVSV